MKYKDKVKLTKQAFNDVKDFMFEIDSKADELIKNYPELATGQFATFKKAYISALQYILFEWDTALTRYENHPIAVITKGTLKDEN